METDQTEAPKNVKGFLLDKELNDKIAQIVIGTDCYSPCIHWATILFSDGHSILTTLSQQEAHVLSLSIENRKFIYKNNAFSSNPVCHFDKGGNINTTAKEIIDQILEFGY